MGRYTQMTQKEIQIEFLLYVVGHTLAKETKEFVNKISI